MMVVVVVMRIHVADELAERNPFLIRWLTIAAAVGDGSLSITRSGTRDAGYLPERAGVGLHHFSNYLINDGLDLILRVKLLRLAIPGPVHH
jgi:hypothetical protein